MRALTKKNSIMREFELEKYENFITIQTSKSQG